MTLPDTVIKTLPPQGQALWEAVCATVLAKGATEVRAAEIAWNAMAYVGYQVQADGVYKRIRTTVLPVTDAAIAMAKGEPGFFTHCMETIAPKAGVDNPEAFCAWLHHERLGTWPGQKRFEVTITKQDDEQRLVFGWGMISKTKDGALVTDLQDDQIDPEELEKGAYDFVLNARAAGEMHEGGTQGQLVESVVFTEEKMAKMGIPPGILPCAHWVGFKLDQALYDKVKKGERLMFSIQGRADRVPVKGA